MKRYEFSPYELPESLLKAIGRVIACAAHTEVLLRELIGSCAGVDVEYAGAITTYMNMPLRFDVLRSIAEIRIDDVDALDELDDIILEAQKAFEKRNAIAHHQWGIDPETGDTFTVKEIARFSYQMDLVPMSVSQVENDALFIYLAGMKFAAFMKKHSLEPTFPKSVRPRAHKTKAARKERRKRLARP